MLDLLFDPDAFFEREVADPDLAVGVVLIVLTGVLTSVSAILKTRHFNGAMPQGATGGQDIFQVVQIVASVVTFAVLWVVFTGAFYGVTNMLDDEAEGSFADVLALTAWGHVPIMLAGVVTAAATFVALRSIAQPTVFESLRTATRSLENHQLVTLGSYAVLAFTLWQGALWTFAIEHALGVDRRDAALAVAGPVVLVVAWHLLATLGVFGAFLPGP